MANIEQRGTTFRARVRRHGAPAMTRTFDTLADAELWSAETEAAVKAGRLDEHRQQRTTLDELLAAYEMKRTWRKKGSMQESSRIARLRQDPLASYSLENLSRATIRSYRDRRLAAGISGSTANRELALISVVLKWAAAERDAPVDPRMVDGLKLAENPARERRLQPGEMERLQAAAPIWLQSYLTLAVETCMRRGELAMLKWADIDLQRRVAVLQTTKNGQPRRVPLSGVALRTLEAMPRNISGFVFQQNLSAVSTAFIAACKKAGIVALRLHDLRAEGVSRLSERGLDLGSIKAISGHKSMIVLRYLRAGDAETLAQRLA
jgi:integrase